MPCWRAVSHPTGLTVCHNCCKAALGNTDPAHWPTQSVCNVLYAWAVAGASDVPKQTLALWGTLAQVLLDQVSTDYWPAHGRGYDKERKWGLEANQLYLAHHAALRRGLEGVGLKPGSKTLSSCIEVYQLKTNRIMGGIAKQKTTVALAQAVSRMAGMKVERAVSLGSHDQVALLLLRHPCCTRGIAVASCSATELLRNPAGQLSGSLQYKLALSRQLVDAIIMVPETLNTPDGTLLASNLTQLLHATVEKVQQGKAAATGHQQLAGQAGASAQAGQPPIQSALGLLIDGQQLGDAAFSVAAAMDGCSSLELAAASPDTAPAASLPHAGTHHASCNVPAAAAASSASQPTATTPTDAVHADKQTGQQAPASQPPTQHPAAQPAPAPAPPTATPAPVTPQPPKNLLPRAPNGLLW